MAPSDSTAASDSSERDWTYGVGRIIEDRYEIVRPIAQGAFGEVHAAADADTGAEVALKILRTNSEQRDPKAVARMRQEAEILRALDHPNLVEVHDVLQVDGRECIVMELLEGRSVRELIDAGELVSPDRATRAVGQILSALEAMHQRGVQHRDLKPDNIIVDRDDDGDLVKLVDFGIAKASDFLDQDHEQTLVETREDGFVGTPRYAAPEQAVGDPIDASSDLFSLGLVVAEWFTGESRLDVDERRGVVSVLIQPEPLDVSDCPEPWQPWLSQMVAKTPQERFRSAREAFEALPGRDRVEQPPEFEEWETWPDSGGPETVDLAASTEATEAMVDTTDETSSADSVDAPPPKSNVAPDSTGEATVAERPDADRRSPESTASSRHPAPTRRRQTSTWLTAGAVAFFLLSLSIFVYTLALVLQ